MVFKVSDLHDLVDLLETHPQWRAQLRRLVLSKDVLALPRIVQELAVAQQRLAEAQQRTEQRVEELAATVRELAAAQQRTEQRVDRLEIAVQKLAEAQQRAEERLTRLEAVVQQLAEAQQRLAEAQQRSEERLTRLEAAVQRLAEAQQRTEAQVRELAAAQQRTEQRVENLGAVVGRLNERFGATLEQEAADVLRVVLENKGYRALGSHYNLALDGEVDVVLPLADPQGQPVWAVLEAKVRLGWHTVEAWAQRMRSSGFQDALRAAGIPGPYLVYVYGLRLDQSARKAAETFGIGLLSDQGEVVPPVPLPNA